MHVYHYGLHISIQIYTCMFQNGQHTLLLWHNIQAHVPITIASNGTSWYENY